MDKKDMLMLLFVVDTLLDFGVELDQYITPEMKMKMAAEMAKYPEWEDVDLYEATLMQYLFEYIAKIDGAQFPTDGVMH